jgi:hypothetical protein
MLVVAIATAAAIILLAQAPTLVYASISVINIQYIFIFTKKNKRMSSGSLGCGWLDLQG